jgi:hypothetical protein
LHSFSLIPYLTTSTRRKAILSLQKNNTYLLSGTLKRRIDNSWLSIHSAVTAITAVSDAWSKERKSCSGFDNRHSRIFQQAVVSRHWSGCTVLIRRSSVTVNDLPSRSSIHTHNRTTERLSHALKFTAQTSSRLLRALKETNSYADHRLYSWYI